MLREVTTIGTPFKVTPLCIEGGNVIVEVDKDDIEKGVYRCQHDVIGKINLQQRRQTLCHHGAEGKVINSLEASKH